MKKKTQHPLKSWLIAHPRVTQRQLAEEVDASQPHINGIANDKAGISKALAKRLAQRTGIALAKLLPPGAVLPAKAAKRTTRPKKAPKKAIKKAPKKKARSRR